MTTRHPTAALTWKGLLLLLVAGVGIIAGMLWVWWPPGTPSSTTGASAADSADASPASIAGGGGVPVRILVMNMAGNTATVELCDSPTTEVLVRWYAANPPSGPVLEQQKLVVMGGSATFPLKSGLFPTAQSLQANGRSAGKEVAPGQVGNCP